MARRMRPAMPSSPSTSSAAERGSGTAAVKPTAPLAIEKLPAAPAPANVKSLAVKPTRLSNCSSLYEAPAATPPSTRSKTNLISNMVQPPEWRGAATDV